LNSQYYYQYPEENMTEEINISEITSRCLEESLAFKVQKRLHEKIDDYADYAFSPIQSSALNVFFDLSQEYESFHDLLAVCVLVPKVFFNLECNLFLLRDNRVEMVATCQENCPGMKSCRQDSLRIYSEPQVINDCFYLPIKGNRDLLDQLPFNLHQGLIGMLELYPVHTINEHDRLFFQKYANRVGFQLHMRMISWKNEEHLQFINALVKDIGHNVIVPNMFFKIFYRRLEAHINALEKLKNDMAARARAARDNPEEALINSRELLPRLEYIHNGLKEQYTEILNHYEQTSLFLETLLRRSHFEQGKYVLERKVCNFKSQIIDPQVERFTPQFREKGIDIALAGVPDQEIEVVVDKGLISQVYANLFSNAVKYTRQVTDFSGNRAKFISYGWEYKPDYFGSEKPGIKLNVFSTGPHLSPEEQASLFREGFRAGNVGKEQGTGHGLFFIKEIVEMHGGEVGYEPTPLGNNFYFVLPLSEPSTL